MRIGELARKTGLTIHALRFYERKGLLPAVQRGPSNYREFSPITVERLKFIREAQQLGFTLTEVRDLLELRSSSAATCEAMRVKGLQKLREVDDGIRRLHAIKAVLSKLLRDCGAMQQPCDVVISLEDLRS